MINLTLSETIRELHNGNMLPPLHLASLFESLIDEHREAIDKYEEKLWLLDTSDDKTNKIIENLIDVFNASVCSKYGEHGYNDPLKGIIFANWNHIEQKIQEYLEHIGYVLEWSDEWAIDYEHDKAYRINGDSYHWASQIAYNDYGDMLTPDTDLSDWLELCQLEKGDDIKNILPEFIDENALIKLGYIKINVESFENGWHQGQTDNPMLILEDIFNTVFYCKYVVFKLDANSQFYSKFSAFYKLVDLDE